MANSVPVYYNHLNRINFPDQWEFVTNITISTDSLPPWIVRTRFFSDYELNTMSKEYLKTLRLIPIGSTATANNGQTVEEEFKLFKRCVGVADPDPAEQHAWDLWQKTEMPVGKEIYEWCYMKEIQS